MTQLHELLSLPFEAVLLFKDYESNYNSNRYDRNDQKQNCQSMLLASFPRRNEDRLSLFWRFEITSRMRQGLLGSRSSLLMSDGFSHRLIIVCTVFREWCIFQIYRVTRGHAHIFAPRLYILECSISISRYILGFGIIDGLLRDMGAMEPRRLRGGLFALRRHKPVVLSLIVHGAL